jgi:hypothetical protein
VGVTTPAAMIPAVEIAAAETSATMGRFRVALS